jgi:hypothetical protein
MAREHAITKDEEASRQVFNLSQVIKLNRGKIELCGFVISPAVASFFRVTYFGCAVLYLSQACDPDY